MDILFGAIIRFIMLYFFFSICVDTIDDFQREKVLLKKSDVKNKKIKFIVTILLVIPIIYLYIFM